MAGVACLLSIVGMTFGLSAIASHDGDEEEITLDMALAALDSGSYARASEMAKKLAEREGLPIKERRGAAFVRGAAAAYEAENAWSQGQAKLYLAAAEHLKDARDRGFPKEREAEGLYLLGKSLYLSNRIPAARLALVEALGVNKERAAEIHGLLADAYMYDVRPNYEKALAENALYLAGRGLSAEQRQQGLLQQAQILLRVEKIPECIATLNKIPRDAPNRAAAIVLQGQVLMHEAETLIDRPDASAEEQAQGNKKYAEAMKTLRRVQGRDTLSTQATRKAMYLIGICHLRLGEDGAALARFAYTAKRYAESPEGAAASFQEGELWRQSGQNEKAIAGYRRCLRAIKDPKDYTSPWITLDELRDRTQAAHWEYLKTNNFEAGLELAKLCYPLFESPSEMFDMMATTHMLWGEALLKQAAAEPREQAEIIASEGRMQWRRAGYIYSRLAEIEIALRSYPDRLWASADAYFRGHNFRAAARVIEEYLKDQTRRRHPQALVLLGESAMALGDADKALENFLECIEFHPRDIASFRARILASQAYIEKGDTDQARKLLEDNLESSELSWESTEWRDSLFAMGELLYMERKWDDAFLRLRDAVRRYGDDPQALIARYQMAECLRQGAKEAHDRRGSDNPGIGRVISPKQIHEQFDDALTEYQTLRDLLTQRQDTIELTPREILILKNCYFSTGSIEFTLGRYDAAINTYGIITSRYQNSPDVLEAYVQIANAYQRLNKSEDSRITLKKARVVLGLIKPEAPFTETTSYTKEEWEQRLDWRIGM